MRRFVFTPRWVAGHVLVLAAVVVCLLLGRWQLHRAELTHSLQNYAYALQWPLFAVFFAVMWARMLLLESRRLDEEAEHEPDEETAEISEPEPELTEPPAAVTQPSPVDDDEDPELAAYNRMLRELAARDAESGGR